MTKTKLEYFIDYATDQVSTDSSIDGMLLIEDKDNDYGIIFSSPAGEGLDNHCQQCQDEEPLFMKFKEYDDFPYRALAATIGKTKLNKILDGNFSLHPDIKIIKDLTYLVER